MPAPAEGPTFAPLVRIFVARFFENDLTASAHDLKHSFFGLVAVLGIPGAAVPFLMSFDWSLIGRYEGVGMLRLVSRADKDLYLAFTMIAAAVICALTWNTLLIDRRDAVVLGSLPIRPRTIVLAKLSALAIYVGAIALTMHTLASATWGLFLAQGRDGTMALVLRGTVAHFVAGSAASACTVFFIMAVQGLLVAVGGPRLFARVSGVFQIVLVAAIGIALIEFPSGSQFVVDALSAPEAPVARWALSMPPAWFLGLYESILGGADGAEPMIRHLAATAGLATVAAFVVAVASNVLAYHRVMRGAVEQEARRTSSVGSIGRFIAERVTPHPDLRAVADFFLTSTLRVERQRLAVGIGVGAAIAFAVPTLETWRVLVASERPSVALLTLPVSAMVLWLVALRVAASLPSDLKASWVFDVQRPPPEDVRAVIERVFLLVGVAPFALVSSGTIWILWGAGVAFTHALFILAIGTLLVEMLLGGRDVPGTQPWRPERARLRARWPIYLIGFLWLADGMPLSPASRSEIELLLIGSPVFSVVFIGILTVAAFAIRSQTIRRLRAEPPTDPDAPEGAPATLGLT